MLDEPLLIEQGDVRFLAHGRHELVQRTCPLSRVKQT